MALSPSAAAFFAEHHAAWLKGGGAPDASFNLFSEDQKSLWSELEEAGLARRADAEGSSWQLTATGQRGI